MKYKGKDSRWEHHLCTKVLKGLPYHTYKVEYTTQHLYEVDFGPIQVAQKRILIEAKGYFRTTHEAAKYKWIRDSLKPNEELVFLFMYPNKPVIWARKRVDGTKLTHSEWAEKNDFRWYDETTIQQLIRRAQ